MSELKLTTDETRVSYGIGRQLGDQLRENPPPGVNLLAIVAGLSDAFNGTPSRVSQDDLSASFKVIREQMQAQAEAQAELAAAAGVAFLAERRASRGMLGFLRSPLVYTLSLSILPLCGVYGFDQTMATLAAGKPCVLVESFEIDEIARLIAQHRPTTLFGSDDMYARLLDAVSGDHPFPSVKWAGYAAFNASLDALAETAERRGLRLCGLYGMSEVQALYSIQPMESDVARRKNGGGVPTSPLAHVRVRDPDSGELLGVGQPGMLECAGPSLMVGYFGNDAATAEAVTADGYVRTGDLAELDGLGGFAFLSRMGDVLRLSGFLVNPLEIETHLQKLPAIAGCQTIAVPRPEGVRAVAFVILSPGATLDEAAAIAHCKHGLANYKVPMRVFAVDDFPKTPSPNGFKIQRARLRDMALERL